MYSQELQISQQDQAFQQDLYVPKINHKDTRNFVDGYKIKWTDDLPTVGPNFPGPPTIPGIPGAPYKVDRNIVCTIPQINSLVSLDIFLLFFYIANVYKIIYQYLKR